ASPEPAPFPPRLLSCRPRAKRASRCPGPRCAPLGQAPGQALNSGMTAAGRQALAEVGRKGPNSASPSGEDGGSSGPGSSGARGGTKILGSAVFAARSDGGLTAAGLTGSALGGPPAAMAAAARSAAWPMRSLNSSASVLVRASRSADTEDDALRAASGRGTGAPPGLVGAVRLAGTWLGGAEGWVMTSAVTTSVEAANGTGLAASASARSGVAPSPTRASTLAASRAPAGSSTADTGTRQRKASSAPVTGDTGAQRSETTP